MAGIPLTELIVSVELLLLGRSLEFGGLFEALQALLRFIDPPRPDEIAQRCGYMEVDPSVFQSFPYSVKGFAMDR